MKQLSGLFASETFGASRLCLGAASFGAEIDRDRSFEVLDRFVELGGNFLDTAHIYAAWAPGCWGSSERLIGEWMRAHGCRDEVVLATKGGHPAMGRMDGGRCSRADLESDLNESLERLGTDRVDLYWLHRDDPGRSAEEMIETLNGFIRDGRVRSVGASNWRWDRIESARIHADKTGLSSFAAAQPGWSLAELPGPPPVSGMIFLTRDDLGYPRGSQLPIVPYTPQAKGFFGVLNTAWAQRGFPISAPRAAEYDSPLNRRRLLAAMRIAAAHAATPNQAALAYLMNQPFPVHPIIGTSNLDHLEEAFGAVRLKLSEEEIRELEQK